MKKLIYILFFTLLTFIFIHKFYYEPEIKNLTQKLYQEKDNQIKELFRSEVEKKIGRTFGLTHILSKDSDLVKALESKDKTILDYKELINEIHSKGEYKNLWIQVIDSEGYSFYRSWSNKTGDDLKSFRKDINQLLKEPKSMKSISAGKFDMTIKTMVPIYNEGKFLGIIEMISKFNSISIILKEHKIESLMLLEEKYSKNIEKPFTNLFIENNYIANLNASSKIIKEAKEFGLKRLMYLDEVTVYKNYLISVDHIKDVQGKEMGIFIFFFDKEALDKTILYDFKNDYYTKVVILFIILSLLFLFLINRSYAKRLKKEVVKKTSKIKKQKRKLSSLLKIYDDHVIFSKTDERGIITHASNAFCKISGYRKYELIGRPHNVVRHPDMPKEAFKQMWETIQAGKVWKGEVKNLRKDGSFYWVEAEVEPLFKNKKIIGYSAVRQNITDAKEIEDIQKEIIFTMGSIGERRSEETGNHVRRVAEYSKLLALKYGLKEEKAEMLKQASPMHDIGKVAISDSILKKPGPLTDEEMEVMKTHAQVGYDMFKGSKRKLLKTAAIVAYEHHEKWDGTGYPRGLKGEEIHIYGRITAIADVFDALGSDRYYKKAWPDDKILKLLKEESGKQFDPKLIEIFFDNLREFFKIRENFKD